MTMDWASGDWVSTDEFLRLGGSCKERVLSASSRQSVGCILSRFTAVTAGIRFHAGALGHRTQRRSKLRLYDGAFRIRMGRSLRIGSSRSIAACGGLWLVDGGARGASTGWASGISAMQMY